MLTTYEGPENHGNRDTDRLSGYTGYQALSIPSIKTMIWLLNASI